jgi:hypothetical protein
MRRLAVPFIAALLALGGPAARAAPVQVVHDLGAEGTWSLSQAGATHSGSVRATRQARRLASGQVVVEERLSVSAVACQPGCQPTTLYEGHKIDGQPAGPGARADFEIHADPLASVVAVIFGSTAGPGGCRPRLVFTAGVGSAKASGQGDRGPSSLAGGGVDRPATVDGDLCGPPFHPTATGHTWATALADRFG